MISLQQIFTKESIFIANFVIDELVLQFQKKY